MGVHLAGFRDEQAGSIQTKKLRTDAIEPWRIERGLVAGWRELEEYGNHELFMREERDTKPLTIDGVPLKSMMIMGYADALPETREELAAEGVFSRIDIGEHT